MKKVKVDYRVIKEISNAAIHAKKQKIYPFNLENLFPDKIVPDGIKKGSKEHALFLFHSVSIDSMRQAEKVYETMRNLTKKLISLKELITIKKKELANLLSPDLGEGITHPKNSMTDPVGTLLNNAKMLEEKCKGDPRQLKRSSVRKTLNKIDEFTQYGIAKAALLMKNYVRFGIWPFSEFEIPLKVDRHTMRISLGCGAIDVEKHSKKIHGKMKLSKALTKANEMMIRMGHYTKEDFERDKIRVVRNDQFIIPLTEAYLRVTKREQISAIELDDALWARGAYSCKINDAIICDVYCPIPCDMRYPSDNNAVWFFIDIDKRKHRRNLFTYSKKNQRR